MVTTTDGDSVCSPSTCPYCNDEILDLAPRNQAHTLLVKTVKPGTELSLFLPRTSRWCRCLLLEELDEGLWLVKMLDFNRLEEPKCYHLVHYLIRNILNPSRLPPSRAFWNGACFDIRLVSRNDIVCTANASWNPELKCNEVDGSIHWGLAGTSCEFSGNSHSANDHSVGLLALVVGLKIVYKFANELAPKGLRVWIITDSK